MGWDGCGVGVINNECIVDQAREEGRGLVRIGLSAAVVIVLAAFPAAQAATKDLISNNGQYKQQEERTILISPPHAMPFPNPCLSPSLSLSFPAGRH